MYNDLYIYNIKKNQWSLLKAPNPPPPRSSHQVKFYELNIFFSFIIFISKL